MDSDSWHQAQFDLSAVTKPISHRERGLGSHALQAVLTDKQELVDLNLFISLCFIRVKVNKENVLLFVEFTFVHTHRHTHT